MRTGVCNDVSTFGEGEIRKALPHFDPVRGHTQTAAVRGRAAVKQLAVLTFMAGDQVC